MLPPVLRQLYDAILLNEVTCFYINCLLCFALYFKFKHSLELGVSGSDTALADEEVDTALLRTLMLYDLSVVALFTFVQQVHA